MTIRASLITGKVCYERPRPVYYQGQKNFNQSDWNAIVSRAQVKPKLTNYMYGDQRIGKLKTEDGQVLHFYEVKTRKGTEYELMSAEWLQTNVNPERGAPKVAYKPQFQLADPRDPIGPPGICQVTLFRKR
jgi:hypothetical protein